MADAGHVSRPGAAARAPADASPAAAFLARVEQSFEEALASAGGPSERDLELAGRGIRLSFAGEALVAPITRATAHLLTPPCAAPHLRVLLWDAASTGVPLPSPPWGREAYGVRSEIAGYNDENVHTVFQVATGSLLLFDAGRNLAVYATADARSLPSYETCAPLRTIFHWWARRGAMQMVHAAAVGREDGCVLLAGESGAGKSSTALACLPSPLLFLSDDYCLLEFRDAGPVVHSVYSAGKASRATLDRLPFLESMVSNPDEVEREKANLYLAEHRPEKILKRAPLRAVLLPRVADQVQTEVRRTSAADAVVTMSWNTHVQLPNAEAEILRTFSRVVRATPSYRLLVGSDAGGIATAIERVLDGRVG